MTNPNYKLWERIKKEALEFGTSNNYLIQEQTEIWDRICQEEKEKEEKIKKEQEI